jgi:hypothetical protein
MPELKDDDFAVMPDNEITFEKIVVALTCLALLRLEEIGYIGMPFGVNKEACGGLIQRSKRLRVPVPTNDDVLACAKFRMQATGASAEIMDAVEVLLENDGIPQVITSLDYFQNPDDKPDDKPR